MKHSLYKEYICNQITELLKTNKISIIDENNIKHGIICLEDICLIVRDDVIKCNEYYQAIDFEIPMIGDTIITFQLADPNCFEELIKFCKHGGH